jgi:hypothetical protein
MMVSMTMIYSSHYRNFLSLAGDPQVLIMRMAWHSYLMSSERTFKLYSRSMQRSALEDGYSAMGNVQSTRDPKRCFSQAYSHVVAGSIPESVSFAGEWLRSGEESVTVLILARSREMLKTGKTQLGCDENFESCS